MHWPAPGLLGALGTPLLIHQPSYSMLNRWIEDGLTTLLEEEGIGCSVCSPLAQGQLTGRYLKEIPTDSRAARGGFLRADQVRANLPKVQALSEIAERRGQSLAQMAIAWVLRLPTVTSALLGASSTSQLQENLKALDHLDFSSEELAEIESALRVNSAQS